MLQVKSRYNERHKNKNITITPSFLLIVCQPEDRVTSYWKTSLLLIPRALWHWHCCLTLTQQSVSRNLGVPTEWGAPLFIVSVPQSTKKILMLLAVVGVGKQALCCTALHTANMLRVLPRAWQLASCPWPGIGELAICEPGDHMGLNVSLTVYELFFLQGKIWKKNKFLGLIVTYQYSSKNRDK